MHPPNPTPTVPRPDAACPARPSRRVFLGCCAGLASGLFASLQAQAAEAPADAAPERLRAPWRNPCRGTLPPALAAHDLLQQAWAGLDPAALWDVHAHLLGTGDAGSGCRVHPSMSQWWHPTAVLRRRVILDAACVPDDAPSVDRAFVDQLLRLTHDFPAGARWLLFAFDDAHDDDGHPRPDWSTFHVPDAYAAQVAAAHPGRFGWVASVHPYRPDALQRLQQAAAAGALAVKWLPSAMNIDLRDARCRPFYAALRRLGLPLVVHCGAEHAVPGAGRNDLGNPLHARAALEAGASVVMAHCASLGRADDLDARSRRAVPAFDLFARLMDEPAHAGLLWGDLSAVFQVNRRPAVWRAVLQRQDWHPRLLHGSDHPLPGVGALHAPRRLVAAGLLDEAAVPVLEAVRSHNPLLFDLVLKRSLRLGSGPQAVRLPAAAFQTRRAFPGALRDTQPGSSTQPVSPEGTRRLT